MAVRRQVGPSGTISRHKHLQVLWVRGVQGRTSGEKICKPALHRHLFLPERCCAALARLLELLPALTRYSLLNTSMASI